MAPPSADIRGVVDGLRGEEEAPPEDFLGETVPPEDFRGDALLPEELRGDAAFLSLLARRVACGV